MNGKHIDHLLDYYETNSTIEDIIEGEGVTEDNMGMKARKIAKWWDEHINDATYFDTYNSYLRAFREYFEEDSK